MNRRVVIVLLIAAIAAIATRVATPSDARHVRFSAALSCGVERWNVKTLKDRPRLIGAQATTIAHLTSLTPPASLPSTRLPFERHIFSIVAAVTLVRSEADMDFHLVLRSGPNHMIAEAPHPNARQAPRSTAGGR